MRISDWSSTWALPICQRQRRRCVGREVQPQPRPGPGRDRGGQEVALQPVGRERAEGSRPRPRPRGLHTRRLIIRSAPDNQLDRKRVVWGKQVSVHVYLGGGRLLQKKTNKTYTK